MFLCFQKILKTDYSLLLIALNVTKKLGGKKVISSFIDLWFLIHLQAFQDKLFKSRIVYL